ncbi:LysR family transcriptional regulator [Dactylosporangium matsuzakiense]|uniref:LysR family transcriptional regulator n=1 Tax=Dactylosporangium matsuzakiense TaxID=53360 RepID=A0A9W6KX93_9ACTN|nr:LysR family transcriptional regulator [Dactylosporangium matsuzakiense]UWZ46718.1 LysR family transcriptional regulator [Dactylosporangium matsuzakiense]GLL08256.1 LysR family transcriptional regulator [Dactylosporangium matsuzakiense]
MAGLRDIECFALVARHRSFSRAADVLSLSQPAVSQSVARLERELGLRLFIRSSRTVALTSAGESLLPHAEAVLAQAGAFAVEAARLAVQTLPGLRLVYAPLVGTFAARLARRLAARKPGLDVALEAGGWSAATQALQRATGGVAALMSSPFPAGFATAARFHVALSHLALPAADPLSTLTTVTLDRARRLLLPRGMALPAGARLAAEAVDDPAAALDLVAAGRGALPVPQLLVDTVRRPDVRFVRLGGAAPRLTFALVWRAESAGEDLMTLVQGAQDLLRR